MNNRKDIEQLKEQLEQMKLSGDLTSLDTILSTVERMEYSPLFKPYGLFFEEYKEDAVEILNTHKLIPTQLDDLLIEKDLDNTVNLLLEGDNYQALKLLQKTHKEKIDVIYIDPPYNTGNKDFVYNDSYVNNEDAFRHSKWLSFMDKRLKLAKNLMSDDGVIFISIDDNEQSQLKLLCDQVFGEQNFISSFIWKCRTGSNDSSTNVSTNHEYILAYSRNIITTKFLGNKKDTSNYKNPDNDPKGSWIKDNPSAASGTEKSRFRIINPFTNEVYLPPKGRYWAFGESRVKEWSESGKLVFPKVKNKNFYLKKYLTELKSAENPNSSTVFVDEILIYTSQGTKKMKDIFLEGNPFKYPKPVELIKNILGMTSNKNAVVLDFFAGSGTTGHAVMELNKEDGGNRTFILATNNEVSTDKELQLLIAKGLVPQTPEVRKGQPFKEWKQTVSDFKETISYLEFLQSDDYNNLGIARQVTYERLKRVINGYTTPKDKVIEGLPNNLKHIRLDTVSNLDAKKGNYSQKDVVFFNENVMEDLDSEYYKAEGNDKLVYVVGEDEATDLLSELKENPTDKEVIIYTNIGVINQYKQLEDGFTFKKFPKL